MLSPKTTNTSVPLQLGLRANWQQFVLLVVVNAFVGGMVGIERTILPLLKLAWKMPPTFGGLRRYVESEAQHTFISGYSAILIDLYPAESPVPGRRERSPLPGAPVKE